MNRKKERWIATPAVECNRDRHYAWKFLLFARRARLRSTQRKNRWLRRKAAAA